MLDNHESPAPADYHHDDAFIIPAEASFFELADTLGRKLNQMRDLCATLSNLDDSAISGVFWFLSDMMTYCDNLTTRIITANPETGTAPDTTPEQTDTISESGFVAMPEKVYDQLGLSLESLRAQALVISGQNTRESYNERTVEALGNAIFYEIDRLADLVSGCKFLQTATFKHRHGPDREQAQ